MDLLAQTYFEMGIIYKNIAYVITKFHHLPTSLRQVYHILQELGLGRRHNYTQIKTIVDKMRRLS